LGPVDFGMRYEGGTIAFVAETPDGAGFARLEIGQPLRRHGIREIGDGIEALDGESGIAVHHHPLGGRGPRGRIKAEHGKKACQYAKKGYSGGGTVSLL